MKKHFEIIKHDNHEAQNLLLSERFEIVYNEFRFMNENTKPNELYIFDSDGDGDFNIDETVKSFQTLFDRVVSIGSSKFVYQIDIDETIKINDELNLDSSDENFTDWSIKELVINVYDANLQQVIGQPIPDEVMTDIAYLIDTIGYDINRQNNYVNLLNPVNNLLKLRNYFNHKKLYIHTIPVSAYNNYYLSIFNINMPVDETSGVFTTLFLKQDYTDNTITDENQGFVSTLFTEAIGLNQFNDKNLLLLISNIKNNRKHEY